MTSQDGLIELATEAANLLASIGEDITSLIADGLPRTTSRAALATLRAVATRSAGLSRLIFEELDRPTVDPSFLQRLLGVTKSVALAGALGAAAIGGIAEGGSAALVQARMQRQSEALAVTCSVAERLSVQRSQHGVLVDSRLYILDEEAGLVIGANPRPIAGGDRLVPVGQDLQGVDDNHVRLSVRGSQVIVTDVGDGRPTYLVGRDGPESAKLLTSTTSAVLTHGVLVRFGAHEIVLVE